MKCIYMFIFPLKKLACKELKHDTAHSLVFAKVDQTMNSLQASHIWR